MTYREYDNFTITRTTGGTIPNLPFFGIKKAILGSKYDLELSFVTLQEATRLHKEYENKKGPANILSFPLDTQSGQMMMSLQTLRQEAPEFEHTYHEHLVFMFIHGCTHLLGYDHGTEMEAIEQKFRKKFISN
ncbi:MAG: rRNA maturation RNase YbeY [Planctomycetota bacterium]|jgi:rRNA maturation RNase YbeY